MSVKPIPESIRKHRGDTAWLEEHGRAAMAEYVALHDKRDQGYAHDTFIKVMFKDPETCVLFARAPRWWREEEAESFEEFKLDLAKIHPVFENAWGGPKKVKQDGEASRAVTVVETRGRTK